MTITIGEHVNVLRCRDHVLAIDGQRLWVHLLQLHHEELRKCCLSIGGLPFEHARCMVGLFEIVLGNLQLDLKEMNGALLAVRTG